MTVLALYTVEVDALWNAQLHIPAVFPSGETLRYP
jgi:hypothetical protein